MVVHVCVHACAVDVKKLEENQEMNYKLSRIQILVY